MEENKDQRLLETLQSSPLELRNFAESIHDDLVSKSKKKIPDMTSEALISLIANFNQGNNSIFIKATIKKRSQRIRNHNRGLVYKIFLLNKEYIIHKAPPIQKHPKTIPITIQLDYTKLKVNYSFLDKVYQAPFQLQVPLTFKIYDQTVLDNSITAHIKTLGARNHIIHNNQRFTIDKDDSAKYVLIINIYGDKFMYNLNEEFIFETPSAADVKEQIRLSKAKKYAKLASQIDTEKLKTKSIEYLISTWEENKEYFNGFGKYLITSGTFFQIIQSSGKVPFAFYIQNKEQNELFVSKKKIYLEKEVTIITTGHITLFYVGKNLINGHLTSTPGFITGAIRHKKQNLNYIKLHNIDANVKSLQIVNNGIKTRLPLSQLQHIDPQRFHYGILSIYQHQDYLEYRLLEQEKNAKNSTSKSYHLKTLDLTK